MWEEWVVHPLVTMDGGAIAYPEAQGYLRSTWGSVSPPGGSQQAFVTLSSTPPCSPPYPEPSSTDLPSIWCTHYSNSWAIERTSLPWHCPSEPALCS